jgi:hypothetical protein
MFVQRLRGDPSSTPNPSNPLFLQAKVTPAGEHSPARSASLVSCTLKRRPRRGVANRVLVIDRVMMAVVVVVMRSMMLMRRICKARVGEKKQHN